MTGEPKPNGKHHAIPRQVVTATFEYPDETGAVVYVIERVEFQAATNGAFLTKAGKHKKSFRQRRPDPDRPGEWIWNVDGVPPIPYQLPELIGAIALKCAVLIVEGKAKVDLLRSWNIPATCCAGGAKKWRAEHAAYLRDADVVILPDNDNSGREHMNVVAASLQGIAKSVRVLELPDLPAKGDVIDWVCAVTRRRFPVGASPTRRPLRPEAIGAVMEVTKWLKPSISVSRIGGSASVQAATRVNAEQASKRTMRRPTRQPFRGRLIRLDEMSEATVQMLRRGSGGGMYTRKTHETREAPKRGQQRPTGRP